jgi:hypothetical protein
LSCLNSKYSYLMNKLTGSLIMHVKSRCKASIKAMSDHHG